MEKTFNDPTQPTPVVFKVIEDASPVEAVLREASNFDLVAIGIGEEFGLESSLFAWKPQRIVSECDRSILIERQNTMRREISITEPHGLWITSLNGGFDVAFWQHFTSLP